jgi:hypothetical protein
VEDFTPKKRHRLKTSPGGSEPNSAAAKVAGMKGGLAEASTESFPARAGFVRAPGWYAIQRAMVTSRSCVQLHKAGLMSPITRREKLQSKDADVRQVQPASTVGTILKTVLVARGG